MSKQTSLHPSSYPTWLFPSAQLVKQQWFSAADYYNTSTTAAEIANYTGTPYGFFHRQLPNFDSGFPIVFDNRLLQADASRLMSVLSEGNYLDDHTATLTARLLTFNEELQVYG